jgi:single-stranded DNA-binding protein
MVKVMDEQDLRLAGRVVWVEDELRFVGQKNTPVFSFKMVYNKSRKVGDEYVNEPLWMKVTVWAGSAEWAADNIRKGDGVYVAGELSTDADGNPRVWTGNDGVPHASFEMVANRVKITVKGEGHDDDPTPIGDRPTVPSTGIGDDIPF